MKRRSSEIIQYIIISETPDITLQQLCEKYKISLKTLQRDIDEIDDFLKLSNIEGSVLSKEGVIRVFSDAEKNTINRQLLMNFRSYYVLSSVERQNYIIILLLNAGDYITMNEIADYLYVSRITILNDMSPVEKKIESYEGKIKSRRGTGIKIDIGEYQARCLIVDILKDAFFESNKEFEVSSVYYYKLVEELYHSVTIDRLNAALKQTENENKLIFSGKGFRLTLFYLYALANRCRKDDDFSRDLDEKLSVQKALTVIESINSCAEIKIPQVESFPLAKFLTSYHVFAQSSNVEDYQEIYAVVVNFLYQVSNALSVCFYDDYALFEFISLHINAMVQRIRSGVTHTNVLKESLKNEYPRVYEAVEQHIRIIESSFKIRVNDDEVSFIVMHLCADMIRREAKNKKLTTIVVCPESVAAATLLRNQIQQYFNVDVAETITVNHIAEENKIKADFIISTVAFKKGLIPVLVVDPILDCKACERIQTLIFTLLKKKSLSVYHGKSQQRLRLFQVLSLHSISILSDISDWEEALRAGSRLLTNDKLTWEGFGDEIVNIVKANGPYIVMNQGIAIAHALCLDHKYESAVSLIVVKKGVNFGVPQLDPVHLIFCMSMNKSETYLQIIRDILEIGRNRSYYDQLLLAKDSKEIHNIIVMHGLVD